MRCFVALGLEPAPGPALVDTLDGLRHRFPELAVPPPQNLHLTLAFLGEVNDDAVTAAGEAMAAAATKVRAGWEVAWGEPGGFPNIRRPRVVWLGLADASRTVRAQAVLASELAARGVVLEDRPFRPHLTLARVRRGGITGERAEELAEGLEHLLPPPTATAGALTLFHSRPGPSHPTYEVIATARCGRLSIQFP